MVLRLCASVVVHTSSNLFRVSSFEFRVSLIRVCFGFRCSDFEFGRGFAALSRKYSVIEQEVTEETEMERRALAVLEASDSVTGQ